jgi:MSHA biogenesis protein MshQ
MCFLVSVLVGLLFASATANAQTYAYRSDVFAYDTPSGSATSVTWHASGASPACTGYPNGDDDWADVVFPGGFSFTFGGAAYTSVRVYSNGILAFPTDNSGFHRDYTSQALPITAAGTPGPPGGCTLSAVPTRIMLVYWLDIVAGTADATTGASVRYELLGTAPNRRFVISWVNVKLYNNTTRYNFQVVLQESAAGVNGNFKYQYTTGSSTGTGATVGVQLSTTDYTQYAYNQNFIDTTLGTTILWYPANQLAGKIAEYRFDEGLWNGTAGEIRDTSGNTQHASRSTASVVNVALGKLCRGGTFTANTSNAVVDAVATPLAPASKGSVSLWYKSTTAWNAGGSDRMLLDATTVAARPFFLLKRANGALRFALTDSAGTTRTAETSTAYTFAAGTWQHIAVSWSVTSGTNQTVMQIMLNGASVNVNGAAPPYRSTTSGSIAALSTFYIGDNRTSGVTPTNGSPNGANGTIDEVYFYGIDINATQAAADMALTRPVCTSLDHFHIVHAGEVVTCNGVLANVTVEAHDVNHALFSLSGTIMQMATSTGNGSWSSVATINPVNNTGGGTGNYTFANEASVVLGLSNPVVETLNININSGGITEGTGAGATCVWQDFTFGGVCDANLNFADSGFLFDVPHHVAEVSQSVNVSAVKKSDNSLVCTPGFASVSRPITFKCSYTNPVTGTLPVRVAGAALNAANNVSAACDATGQAVTLAFNASGVAATSVQYADVGNMTLTAQYSAGGVTMTGTDGFVAAPASFAFSGVTGGLIQAGVNFSATVTARNSALAATPNFGKETVPEAVTLASVKYQPSGVGAVNGAFAGSLPAFSGGAATSANLNWSEVGTIDLTGTLSSLNYLGSGLSAVGSTGITGAVVGRFIPHHFDTVLTEIGCVDNFSYSAQPFTVTTTARNLAGGVTQNYDGSVNTTPNFSKAVTLSEVNAVAGNLAPTAVAANLFAAGVATTSPTFTFTVPQTPPASIRVRAADTDGASSATGAEGVMAMRSGRLRLQNAYGSELLALPIPLEAQFWAPGGFYATNTLDNCTVVPASSIVMNGWTSALNACETQLAPAGNLALANGKFLSLVAPFGPGLTLTRPGAGNSGNVNLTINVGAAAFGNTCISPASTAATAANMPWFGLNPGAKATFGIHKSPLIYRRENY